MAQIVRLFPADLGKLLASFVVAAIIGGFGSHMVEASHSNRCGNDGEYLHSHLYRDDNELTHMMPYDADIINESGGANAYSPDLSGAMFDWEAGQTYVEFVGPGTTELDIFVDDYSATYPTALGVTTTTPSTDLCASSSTHVSFVTLEINSDLIQSMCDANHARETTFAHELGHAIGLGHNNTSQGGRVMYHAFDTTCPIANATAPQTGDFDRLDWQSDPYGHTHHATFQ